MMCHQPLMLQTGTEMIATHSKLLILPLVSLYSAQSPKFKINIWLQAYSCSQDRTVPNRLDHETLTKAPIYPAIEDQWEMSLIVAPSYTSAYIALSSLYKIALKTGHGRELITALRKRDISSNSLVKSEAGSRKLPLPSFTAFMTCFSRAWVDFLL
ncbi:hypothetical protein BDW75DRAFT_225013 [Aspergillus navahoensis]